jgi:hypothetical protein
MGVQARWMEPTIPLSRGRISTYQAYVGGEQIDEHLKCILLNK